jgi:dTDP-glucose pyrophosphorylase
MANTTAFADQDDVLVIAEDGIFNDNLSDMITTFYEKKTTVVALYQVRSIEEAKRSAIVTTYKKGKILHFTEKPTAPKTTMGMRCGIRFSPNCRKAVGRIFGRGIADRSAWTVC